MSFIDKMKRYFIRSPRRFWNSWRNSLRGDYRHYARPGFAAEGPTLILVVGAESTATRFVTRVLSSHSRIVAAASEDGHADILDEVWTFLDSDDLSAARSKLPDPGPDRIFVTRRSMPHALRPGSPADFFEFPPLTEFIQLAKQAGFRPLTFVTVRSPIPNIMSWKKNRSSAGESLERSIKQYQAVYPYIFDAVTSTACPYYILPEEALIADRRLFLDSIFFLLGLDPPDAYPDIRDDVNSSYYREFADNREKILEGR